MAQVKNKTLFTKREMQVLRLIAKQYTNTEIAGKLTLSRRTVEDYRERLLTKTKSKNSIGIVLYAIKHDLITY